MVKKRKRAASSSSTRSSSSSTPRPAAKASRDADLKSQSRKNLPANGSDRKPKSSQPLPHAASRNLATAGTSKPASGPTKSTRSGSKAVASQERDRQRRSSPNQRSPTHKDSQSQRSLLDEASDPTANFDQLPLHIRLCQRLKEARRRLNWTLDQASSSSDVSRSMISQIERGMANPTLAVAYRLASAYGLSLGELVEPKGKQPRINLVRASDRNSLFRDDARCRVRTLSPLSLEKDVEFYAVTIHPEQRMESSPHYRETREFVTVERGSLIVISGDEEVRLERGDSAQYPADVAHSLINPGKTETVAFLVVIYPNR